MYLPSDRVELAVSLKATEIVWLRLLIPELLLSVGCISIPLIHHLCPLFAWTYPVHSFLVTRWWDATRLSTGISYVCLPLWRIWFYTNKLIYLCKGSTTDYWETKKEWHLTCVNTKQLSFLAPQQVSKTCLCLNYYVAPNMIIVQAKRTFTSKPCDGWFEVDSGLRPAGPRQIFNIIFLSRSLP